MSRIQDILNKAERDGGVHRTRGSIGDRRGAGCDGLAEPADVAARRAARAATDTGRRRRAAATGAGRRAGSATAGRSTRGWSPRTRRSRSPPSSTARCAPAIKSAENGRALRTIIDHQPEQGGRQEPDRREPGADDGAGVPAARAARRRRPAAPLGPPAVRHRRRRPG